MIRSFGKRKREKMSNVPPNTPRTPSTPSRTSTPRTPSTPATPSVSPTTPRVPPTENAPTTLPGSGQDKAPESAPQSVSADKPSTVNPDDSASNDEGNKEGAGNLQGPKDAGDKSLQEVAKAAASGEFGHGQEMRRNLKRAGFDHREVQKEMVKLRNP